MGTTVPHVTLTGNASPGAGAAVRGQACRPTGASACAACCIHCLQKPGSEATRLRHVCIGAGSAFAAHTPRSASSPPRLSQAGLPLHPHTVTGSPARQWKNPTAPHPSSTQPPPAPRGAHSPHTHRRSFQPPQALCPAVTSSRPASSGATGPPRSRGSLLSPCGCAPSDPAQTPDEQQEQEGVKREGAGLSPRQPRPASIHLCS